MGDIKNYEHPYVTVDGVILKASYGVSDSLRSSEMKWDILLVQRDKEPQKGSWSLPGGMREICISRMLNFSHKHKSEYRMYGLYRT